MTSRLHRAGDADAARLAELYLRARRAAAASGSIPAGVHSDDETRRWMAQVVIPERECWVAEGADSALVGLLVLEDEWIDQLYVDPDLTGRGLGSELLALARARRPEGLRLWTFASNTGAQRFYERHGFEEVRRTDGSDNEEQAPDIEYSWRPSP